MSKRLSMDASIVLRNAGYETKHVDYHRGKPLGLMVDRERLAITSGTVDNDRVVELLKARGR